MRELARGLFTVVAAAIVFTPVIAIGIVYNLGYPFVMAWKEKSLIAFFKILWRLLDGTLATIGNMLYDGFSIKYDELANVWGEWIEDACTTEENTQFGKKGITVSAAVGHLEYAKIFMFERAKKLSKVLNVAFREKRHALGSWLKKLAYDEIDDKNLKGKL
jgi:hypothetical protein